MATYDYSTPTKDDGLAMTKAEYDSMIGLAKNFMSGNADAADLVQKVKKAGEDLHREAAREAFYDAIVSGANFYAKAHGLPYSRAFLEFLKTDDGRLLQSANYASRGLPMRSDWMAIDRQKARLAKEGGRGPSYAAFSAMVDELVASEKISRTPAIAKAQRDPEGRRLFEDAKAEGRQTMYAGR